MTYAIPTPVRDDLMHPAARALLDAMPQRPPLETLMPAEARAFPVPLAAAPEAVGGVEQRGIVGPGGWLPLRIYRPADGHARGALVYLHGGGWVLGSLDGVDRLCRAVTNRARCVVVSVDYRLAPETRFPGALEDTYSALLWTTRSAGALGINGGQLAVGGSSAGGNLAAAVALMARDRGGPPLASQILIVPVIDHRSDTASYERFSDGYGLTRADMRWYWGHYLARPEDADDAYASVLRARDLGGLPPAMVVTAGCDPLRDEGEAYAERLRSAGVEVGMQRYEGMPHGFLGFLGALDDAERAANDISAELRRRLAA